MINKDHESFENDDSPDVVVHSLSGRVLGYGYVSRDGTLTVFKATTSDDDEFEGLVSGSIIEFSSGEISALIDGDVVRGADGSSIALIKDDFMFNTSGEKFCCITGRATDQQKAGAGVLLVLNKWMLPDGSPNLEVR